MRILKIGDWEEETRMSTLELAVGLLGCMWANKCIYSMWCSLFNSIYKDLPKVCTCVVQVSAVCMCVYQHSCGVKPPTNEAKKTASRPQMYLHPPLAPLACPSRHISVMAPYRSWGLLVHTQCTSIGTIQRVSEGCFISCGCGSLCVCMCVKQRMFIF